MKNKLPLSLSNHPIWKKVSILLGIIFFGFVALDLFFPEYVEVSSGLKLLTIVVLSFAQILLGRKDQSYWKKAAVATIFTDYLLLFTRHYEWGIFFFIFVQFMRYLQRMIDHNNYHPYILGFSAMGFYLFLQVLLPQLIALSITYGVFLLLNTKEAYHSGEDKLFIAYLLFCLCDLCVVLGNLLETGIVASGFRKLIWIFYLPSQVLLADHIIEPLSSKS